MLILGGMRSITGAVLGTIMITFGLEGVRFMETGPVLMGVKFPEMLGLSGITLGLVIVLVMVLRNGGLVGNFEIEQIIFKKSRSSEA